MSGYWHDANYTTVEAHPSGSILHGFDGEPVADGNIALSFTGDESSVIEGEKDYLIGLLELALDKVRLRREHDPIGTDYLPEDTWYWPEEFEDWPDFITTDGGETWTPLCGKCGRRMEPLRNRNSQANWECTNYDEHGLSLALIWAEDWPDYEEEEYTEVDWRYEVANGDTTLGFAEWVKHKKEADR